MTARLGEAVQVTCHPRGDSLGPGSATLGGSAHTPRDSTRAFNGASNGDPAGNSSPAATAPPTTKERDQAERFSFHSLTGEINGGEQDLNPGHRLVQMWSQPSQTTRPQVPTRLRCTPRLTAWCFIPAFYRPSTSPLPPQRAGGKILEVLFFSGVFLNV